MFEVLGFSLELNTKISMYIPCLFERVQRKFFWICEVKIFIRNRKNSKLHWELKIKYSGVLVSLGKVSGPGSEEFREGWNKLQNRGSTFG